jgi:hypothetical protein
MWNRRDSASRDAASAEERHCQSDTMKIVHGRAGGQGDRSAVNDPD